jgi:hypothetical protein
MLSFGLYEQVINKIIMHHLEGLSSELVRIQTTSIDSAESSKILAEYLALLIRDVLDYIQGETDVVENRVILCNNLIEYIAASMENGKFGFKQGSEIAHLVRNRIIHQDARLLLALVDKKSTRSLLHTKTCLILSAPSITGLNRHPGKAGRQRRVPIFQWTYVPICPVNKVDEILAIVNTIAYIMCERKCF